jgi:hypothetical protein
VLSPVKACGREDIAGRLGSLARWRRHCAYGSVCGQEVFEPGTPRLSGSWHRTSIARQPAPSRRSTSPPRRRARDGGQVYPVLPGESCSWPERYTARPYTRCVCIIRDFVSVGPAHGILTMPARGRVVHRQSELEPISYADRQKRRSGPQVSRTAIANPRIVPCDCSFSPMPSP